MTDAQLVPYLANIAQAISSLVSETRQQNAHLEEIRRALVSMAQSLASKR
jgi:hypothetical protein